MAAAAMTNVFALEYGEEWGGMTSNPPVSATAAPSGQTETNTDTAYDASYGTYKDVPTTHWAYNAVERCSASNWFSGYPDGTFRPDGKITRAEALKVFVTFLGEPLPTDLTSTSYYDVKISDWYAPYIEAGKDLFPQRLSMSSQPKFQPDMPVTREDTVYALVNALNYDQLITNADQSVLNMFSDQNSISEICKAHMAVAVSNELVSGYSDGTIGAQDPLTRAQFATLLYRATYIGALAETEKKLVKVDIEPNTLKEINVGESFEITATATYSDGSTEDYTSQLNPYTDSQEGIVTINKNKVTGVSEGTVLINYNNETVADQSLVVNVKPDPDAVTPEPVTPEPEPEPEPPIDTPEIPEEVPDDPDKVTGKVELAFVIDSTGSMSDEINNVKSNITTFVNHLATLGVDLKMSIVEFRDITCDGLDSTKVHYYDESTPWHPDAESLIATLNTIGVGGGGDAEETSVDAFGHVLDNKYMDWSGDAYKFAVLLTDAGCKTDNVYGIESLEEIASSLASKNINTSVITDMYAEETYKILSDSTEGIMADIMSDFGGVLSELADKIVEVSL